MPYPGLLYPKPLPLQQPTADPLLHRRHSNTVLSQSLCHAKSRLIGKDSDVGRDCRQEEKGTTEDEMAGWHH